MNLGPPVRPGETRSFFNREVALDVRGSRVVLAWSDTPVGGGRDRVHVWQHRDGAWSPLGEPLTGLGEGRGPAPTGTFRRGGPGDGAR